MKGVREICDRYGIVFIADEVMAGFGRTGKWFAIEHFDVVPDLITFAKGVTSGLRAARRCGDQRGHRQVVRRPAVSGRIDILRPSAGDWAARSRPSTRWRTREWSTNAARIGADVLGPGLRELAARHPSVGEVRGLGVFWAIELVRDQGDPRTARAVWRLQPRDGGDPCGLQGRTACSRSPTSTASTQCRRATSATTRSPRAYANSMRRSPSPTGTPRNLCWPPSVGVAGYQCLYSDEHVPPHPATSSVSPQRM